MKYRIEADLDVKSYDDIDDVCDAFMNFLAHLELPVAMCGTKVITDDEEGINTREFTRR